MLRHLLSFHNEWDFRTEELRSAYREVIDTLFDNFTRIVMTEKKIGDTIGISHRGVSTMMYHLSNLMYDSVSQEKVRETKFLMLIREILARKDQYLLPCDINKVEPMSQEDIDGYPL